MSIKSTFGLDGIELGIHVLVTAIVLGFTATFNRPDEALFFFSGTAVSSLVLLSIRRRLALRKGETRGLTTGEMAAERLAEMEERIAELEAGQARMAELEERLDFAERLLARPPEQRTFQPDRQS
ncbi:MAG TPA: hypothetical protein VLB00_02930 [Gemmatimonadales bacterium]|nr:hypothetical protein [Gemmatimonadales bacterium]